MPTLESNKLDIERAKKLKAIQVILNEDPNESVEHHLGIPRCLNINIINIPDRVYWGWAFC